MKLLLALLLTLSLPLRGNVDKFPLHSVGWETESDLLSTPSYTVHHKWKRGELPGIGIPIPISEEGKMEIVNVHNNYREHVFPPAANMRYMRYNDAVASEAQIWANRCEFEHGRPPVHQYPAGIGQNMYKGHQSSFAYYISLWYREVHDFDMKRKQCDGSQCGHYIQAVWAGSFLIGCGQAKCQDKRRSSYYLFVCHYHTPFTSYNPYKIGKPCSLCDEVTGQYCYRNMCVSRVLCEEKGPSCECNLKCHNCGVLNESTCTCNCSPGWDLKDCSRKCEDISEYCGERPGYPNNTIGCAMDNAVAKKYDCRKMCGSCQDITEDNKQKACCEGKRCDTGYVLDHKGNCTCRVLCPGPECYTYADMEDTGDADTGNAFRGVTFTLNVLTLTIHHILRKIQA